MLELRPICEQCAKSLPPDAPDAMICSYECTFCRDCVDQVLSNVCPNCGGGLVARPIRPKRAWRDELSVIGQPPTELRKHCPVDPIEHAEFAAEIRGLPPEQR